MSSAPCWGFLNLLAWTPIWVCSEPSLPAHWLCFTSVVQQQLRRHEWFLVCFCDCHRKGFPSVAAAAHTRHNYSWAKPEPNPRGDASPANLHLEAEPRRDQLTLSRQRCTSNEHSRSCATEMLCLLYKLIPFGMDNFEYFCPRAEI